MFEKNAHTAVPIHPLMARRWSGRAYDPDRPVAREDLLAMLEAARWAPSCYGDQPWRFIVWDRIADEPAWWRAFSCLAEGNRSWAGAAPVLLLATADTLFSHNGKPNRWAAYDTGAASMSLVLQATALGIMAHQMGGFDAARLREEFSIPEQVEPMAMITLGYQLSLQEMDEAQRERETAPRQRRPLGENFFEGEWGRPVRIR
ncbi:MAG: nitroreductase [Gammaproteobacteria bacterium]|nr:MAG: nitroreductase [Gammaproteobacteria bacterium]